MKVKEGVAIFFVLFLLNFLSASFQVGNSSHSIEKQYGSSENISGWVNISLNQEPADSLFSYPNGNSTKLIDLILGNSNFTYSCNVPECKNDYASEGGRGKNSINLSLYPRDSKLVGIKIKGNINSIDSLNLTLQSNANASCSSQIELDFLNDGSVEFINTNPYAGGQSCESLKNKGCFNSSKESDEYFVGKFPNKHCQNVTLYSSPGFRLGAWIDNESGGDKRNITMALYDSRMELVENNGKGIECILPIAGRGEVSCNINFSVEKPTKYYVCVYSTKTGGTDDAQIRGYSDSKGCGFYGAGKMPETEAFDIFAHGVGFGAIGELNISDAYDKEDKVMSTMKDYISLRYEDQCPSEGCIIPLLIKSNEKQDISIKDLKLRYSTTSGEKLEDKLYLLTSVPPRINSSTFQKLFLDSGNFSVPPSYGNYSFQLSLNGTKLFSENISIKNFPKVLGITPTLAPAMIPTDFEVSKSTNKTIIEYSWDFNDSTPIQKTTTNKITHTYPAQGTYDLTIKLKDSDGLEGAKTFQIIVGIPKEQIKTILDKDIASLEKIKAQIKRFDELVQDGLNAILRTREVEQELKDLQILHNMASKEEDYGKIIENLSRIEVPDSITLTKQMPFLQVLPSEDRIDLETLKEVAGGYANETDAQAFLDAVLIWELENANLKMSLEEFSSSLNGKSYPILNKVIIDVKKNYSEKSVYLFLEKIEGLIFKEKYFEKESGNYFYWMLGEDEKQIEFVTPKYMGVENLPVFLSPSVSALSIEQKKVEPTTIDLKQRWGAIILSLTILLLIAGIIYIALSIWYRRRYESYLFKNRNDLYNLISYVDNSKKKGESEEIMKNNLKKSGWTGEQVTYILNKYAGKRTGMIELPITKFIDRLFDKSAKPVNPPQKTNPPGFMKKPF